MNDLQFHPPASDPVIDLFHKIRQFVNRYTMAPTHVLIGEKQMERIKRSLHLRQLDPTIGRFDKITRIDGLKVIHSADPEDLRVGVML